MDRRAFIIGSGGAAVTAYHALTWLYNPKANAAADIAQMYNWNRTLQIPQGFECKLLQTAMEPMSDGYRVPGYPDGMACFAAGSNLVLFRNHEVSRGDREQGPYFPGQAIPQQAYDQEGMGGVTRLEIGRATLEVLDSRLALTGTARNCAGGISPWGWLSCEETVERDHGYVFLCPTDRRNLGEPWRLECYGRFNHEAACIDPRTHIAYLTEDRDDGCFYRFVPTSFETPFEGKLQALRVNHIERFNTSDHLRAGEQVAISWVDISAPNPSQDNVRFQAQGKGAAIIKRGEGLWQFGNKIFFSATSGGPIGKGQIFCLEPDGANGGTLEVICESADTYYLEMPDNITVSPWGDVWLVEDNGDQNCIRVIKPDGRLLYFGKNILSRSELTGICFDDTGETMFLNIQVDGLTLAIRGDFRNFGI